MNGRLTAWQNRQAALIVWGVMVVSMCMYLVLMGLVPARNGGPMPLLVLPLTGLAIFAALLSVFLRSRFLMRPGEVRSASATRAAYVVSAAFSEVPAILGLVIHFITNFGLVWPFFAISAVALALNYPRRSEFGELT